LDIAGEASELQLGKLEGGGVDPETVTLDLGWVWDCLERFQGQPGGEEGLVEVWRRPVAPTWLGRQAGSQNQPVTCS